MYRQLLNIFHFNKVFWWIICFILIANIFFFATFGRSQKIRINELQKTYNIKRSSPTLKQDIDHEPYFLARDDINTFKEMLPEKKDFAETAAELFMILNSHSIDIGQTVYKPEPVDFKGLFKYTTSLSVLGSYSSLKALLADIQESKALFCIEGLSISDSSKEGTVEMKLDIAAFFK